MAQYTIEDGSVYCREMAQLTIEGWLGIL